MNISNSFIKLAIDEAIKSNHKQKVGVVIFKKKVILSCGHNCSQRTVKKLHPKFQRFPFSVHAEVDAIIKAKKDLKGSSLLVIRVNAKNQFRLSRPCKKCMEYIKYTEIKRVFYSTSNFPYIAEITDI